MDYFYSDALMLICKNGRKFAILKHCFCPWMKETAKTVPLAKWRHEIDRHNALYVGCSVGDVNNFQFNSYKIKTKDLYSSPSRNLLGNILTCCFERCQRLPLHNDLGRVDPNSDVWVFIQMVPLRAAHHSKFCQIHMKFIKPETPFI